MLTRANQLGQFGVTVTLADLCALPTWAVETVDEWLDAMREQVAKTED